MKSRAQVLLFLLLFIPSQPSHAQLGGLAVGVALNKLMDQVNTAIISARNAGNSVAIEAGREVAIAISDAQNAYADSLNKTFDDHLNPTIRGTLDQLQTAANGITAATNASHQDATARAQQVVNSLPFRQHEPQLTKFSPRFIVPAGTIYPVIIKFNGNFEFAARQAFAPTLSIGTHSHKTISSTTQELDFSVPVSDLFTAQAAPKQFHT